MLSNPDSLRRVFQEGFSVLDVAQPLPSFDSLTACDHVKRVMSEKGMDVVGIRADGIVSGFVEIAGLAFLNRLTRVVPIVAAFALLGSVARPLDLQAGPVAFVYAFGWVLFYAAFWWVRRPGDRPYERL